MRPNISDELLKKGATYTMEKPNKMQDYLTTLEVIILDTGIPTKYLRSEVSLT